MLSRSVAAWLTGPCAPLVAGVDRDFHLMRPGATRIHVRDGYPVA